MPSGAAPERCVYLNGNHRPRYGHVGSLRAVAAPDRINRLLSVSEWSSPAPNEAVYFGCGWVSGCMCTSYFRFALSGGSEVRYVDRAAVTDCVKVSTKC